MNYGNDTRLSASDIYAQLEESIAGSGQPNAYSKNDKALSKLVFDASCQFLADNRLLRPEANLSGSGVVVSCESFNGEAQLNTVGNSGIAMLLEAAKIPPAKRDEATRAVMVLLAKAKACNGDNDLYRTQHFTHGNRQSADSAKFASDVTTCFAPSVVGNITNIGMPSSESFGANIDKVLPDIRASLAVTLLQFHRGLMDRIMHRRTSASPYVKYVVPYAEVYDMLKSNDASSKVRNQGDHIEPFIGLYGDPRSVSNNLQPVIPLVSNDTEGVMYSDGFLKFNHRVCMFDLSKIANQLGKSHYNYTDLISENVILDCVLVELTVGSKTEVFPIPLANVNGSRLQMQANTVDSGIRAANVTYTHRLNHKSKTINGLDSEILAVCSDTDYLRLELSVSMQCNLKYADVEAYGYVRPSAYNKNSAPVAAAVADLVGKATVTLAAYSPDMRYSEENLRKSNLAIRHNVRTFDFEISNGRNIMVDYSFNEELPEFLMSLVTEATSLGQDHRGIDIIIKQLMHVFDVTNVENAQPDFRSRLEKVGFQYVAAQLVRPVVYLNTIDLNDVDTIRSGDMLGDIRQYVEWELMNLVSLLYQNSFYKHQLKTGETPVFKLFTSSVILENLLSIPHYHNHLDRETPADGTTVEYRRVLPNGTVLDCVTVTFNYMRDKMVLIPYRENDPESVLNFGHHWDFGTFVAHYNPQLDNGVNKRVFSNSRAMPIPTNPMGLYLDIRNISKITDMFAVTNPTASTLPQPAEVLAAAE